MCHLATHRALLTGVFCALAVLGGDAPTWEPYLVLDRQAELYDGPNRVPLRLLPGEVVSARPDELHRGWLRLTLNRKDLQARAEHFGRLCDLEATHARRTADLDSRIAANTRRTAQQEETADRLYAAAQAVRFDAAVQYRYRQLVPLYPPGAAPGGWPRTGPPVQAVQYVDSYDDKIPPARARSLAERWSRERRAVEEETERLREERRECVRDRVSAAAQRADVAWRFAAFAADPEAPAGEPYITVQDHTQLYADTLLAQELDAGVVVLATSNREDGQWLKVRWQGQILDGRKSCFLSRLAVEEQFGRRAAWLAQALSDRQEQADSLAGRRQLLEAVGLAADYAAQIDYVALRAYPFAPDYRGGRYYLPPACPAGAVEVVNRSRARSLLKACDKELDAIDEESRRADKALRAWRRELATIGPRLEDLRRRLDAAR